MWSYPYNSLRNQAIARTQTKLLVLLDVDFLLRRGLRDHLIEPENYQALLVDAYVHKDIIVLPAFETKQGLPLDEGLEIAMKAFRSKDYSMAEMCGLKKLLKNKRGKVHIASQNQPLCVPPLVCRYQEDSKVHAQKRQYYTICAFLQAGTHSYRL